MLELIGASPVAALSARTAHSRARRCTTAARGEAENLALCQSPPSMSDYLAARLTVPKPGTAMSGMDNNAPIVATSPKVVLLERLWY